NFNPLGPPYGHSPPRFQGVQQQVSWIQVPPPSFQGFHLQESVVPLGAPTAHRFPPVLQFGHLGGAAANTSSHGFESSPPSSTQQEKQSINIEDLSDSMKKKMSGFSILGHITPLILHKRSVKQLKTHWGDVKRDITKFNGAYARAMSARSSEQSDDMVLKAAHEMFKGGNKGKSFIYEYLWKVAKEMPKWCRIIQQESTTKRTKLSSSGAYTFSSNQDTEGETMSREVRPEGQKKAKTRLKGTRKSAAPSPLSNQPSQTMVMYLEAMSMKAKTARDKKYKTYLKLLAIDTSNFNEKEKS
ncbi:hypothetical protein PVAP13_8NG131800, partial [Panicum virgatum]